MEVKSHNEMGILAENLNAMLDDIDMLTEEKFKKQGAGARSQLPKETIGAVGIPQSN